MQNTMTTTRQATSNTEGNGAELWQMADALRGSMDVVIAENLEKLGFGER